MNDDVAGELDSCGCCDDDAAPPAVFNAPGLPELRYRVGTHAEFRDRMLRAIPSATAGDGRTRPLARLTNRATDDTTIALLDSVATVADILTFYQERIANEGFLRTATERRSVLELARAIGYELSPGVAASVHLSFTVEDAPGAPLQCLIPKGTAVQSVPPQGKMPQTFETSKELLARAEWNAMRPRLTRPADMAILVDGATDRLVTLVPSGSAPAGAGVISAVVDSNVRRLDPSLASTAASDAVEVTRVYFTEAASDVAKGDLLLFAGGEGAARITLLRRITAVLAEPERKRLRVDIESLSGPSAGAATIGYQLLPLVSFARVKLGLLAFNQGSIGTHVVSKTWRERDLQAMIGIQGWSRLGLVGAVNTPPRPAPAPPASGAFAFREKVGFFGNSAPKWSALPKSTSTNGTPYPEAWDALDKTGSPQPQPAASRTIWEDSQGVQPAGRGPQANGPHTFLERPVQGIAPGSWIVVESPFTKAKAWTIHHANDVSRADYGVSGRTTALTLGQGTTGDALTALPTEPFRFRDATAHVNSRRLALAESPIEAPVDAGARMIELDRMVLDLATGQAIIVAGERADMPGVEAAEVAFLDDIIHAGGNTTLLLSSGLVHGYRRETVRINANVLHATHGESVQEILGGGNAAMPNQTFVLSKPPLTYVSSPAGAESTLVVRVDGVRWTERASLYAAPPDEQAYVVRIDDDARPHVTFGDGTYGARTLTGLTNITASYRSGTGPDGEVASNSLTLLRSMPLGLRGVTNALPAAGAEAPEKLADARRNAPRTVLTFERVVSLTDYEDFARTFPGIGKALVDVLWADGEPLIHLTIAAATGGTPSGETLSNLVAALGSAGDTSQRVVVNAFAPRYFSTHIALAVDPRHVKETVIAGVEANIHAAFSFDARQFGQPVTGAEMLKIIHQTPGVIAANLLALEPYSESASPESPTTFHVAPVMARRARWDGATGRAEPAELLLVNPVGILIGEMPI